MAGSTHQWITKISRKPRFVALHEKLARAPPKNLGGHNSMLPYETTGFPKIVPRMDTHALDM